MSGKTRACRRENYLAHALANTRCLQEKSNEEGVEALPGGIFYKVLCAGTDEGETPALNSVITAHYTGRTINSYLTEVRLEKAKDLLKNSSMHLQDICYRIGYLSPSYFSRLFRKYYGLTPSEYRESLTDQE